MSVCVSVLKSESERERERERVCVVVCAFAKQCVTEWVCDRVIVMVGVNVCISISLSVLGEWE